MNNHSFSGTQFVTILIRLMKQHILSLKRFCGMSLRVLEMLKPSLVTAVRVSCPNFSAILQLLGITHTSSVGLNPRSNGMCEMAVKRLNEGIRRYASDTINDRQIELILPIRPIEMSMRAFEVVHGYPMPIRPPPLKSNRFS